MSEKKDKIRTIILGTLPNDISPSKISDTTNLYDVLPARFIVLILGKLESMQLVKITDDFVNFCYPLSIDAMVQWMI